MIIAKNYRNFYIAVCFLMLHFNSLEPDDVAIFLRWLVVHLHSIKKVFCFIKKLRWLSVSYRQNISTKAGNILDSHEVIT